MKVKIPRAKSPPKPEKKDITARDYAFAVHEAGHAVALFIHGIKFRGVSLKMKTETHDGYIDTIIIGIVGSEYHYYRETPVERCFDYAICGWAGAIAEMTYSKRSQSEIIQDSDLDINQANYLCERAGVPAESVFNKTVEFVNKYGPQIKLIAKDLLDSQRLSYKDVQIRMETYKVKCQSPSEIET
jgi:hypothetical protein